MLSLELASHSDIPELLALWNSSFGPQWPLTERLLRQTLEGDPYYEAEGNQVARQDGRVVGWVLCKSNRTVGPELGRFQNRGGIGALCVHPDHRRRGIGTQLCEAAEAHLLKRGAPLNTLYYPHHLLPGVPQECEAAIAFFEARGYRITSRFVDVQRNLDGYTLPGKAQAALANNPTVEIRRAHAREQAGIVAFVEREFPGGWTYSTKSHFARGGAAGDFVVAVEHEEVIGFCHTADWRTPWLLPSTYWHPLLGERYGGLGPIGLAKDHRKRGLGLALCAVAVQELKNAGVESMAIDWTTLVDFYGQMGFTVWKNYCQMEK